MNTTQYAMAGVFDGVSWGDSSNGTGVSGSGNFSTPSNAPTSSGGGFLKGTNLMGLLSTIGGTWAQIEAAKSGRKVIVQDGSGSSKDISNELMQKLDQQAKANKTSVDGLMQMMQMQMLKDSQDKPNPVKDNTALYVGLGVGALVLLGGIVYVTQKKK